MKKSIIVSLVGLLMAVLFIPCFAYPEIPSPGQEVSMELTSQTDGTYYHYREPGSIHSQAWDYDIVLYTYFAFVDDVDSLSWPLYVIGDSPDVSVDPPPYQVYIYVVDSTSDNVGESFDYNFGEPIYLPDGATAVSIWAQSVGESFLAEAVYEEYEPNTFFYAIKEWVTDVLIDDFLGFGDLLPSDQTAVSIVSLLLCLVVFAVPIILVILVIKFFAR